MRLKALLLCTTPWLLCSAFVSPSTPTSRQSSSLSALSERSTWASSDWTFYFNLGREPGTLMDENWGAAGGRLVFDLPVSATSDKPSTDKEDAMIERNGYKLSPLADTTYKTEEGEKQCAFVPGEWKIQLPRGTTNGKAGKFMCYVDLKTSIRKGDIFLDKGERIYLTAKCWREGELDRALTRLKPYQQEFRYRDEKLNKASPDQTGYERLIIDRDNALEEYQNANIYFPTIDDDDEEFDWTPETLEWQEGPWPGELEWLTIEPLFMMVRRTKFFVKEEYHVIGTWAATPIAKGEE